MRARGRLMWRHFRPLAALVMGTGSGAGVVHAMACCQPTPETQPNPTCPNDLPTCADPNAAPSFPDAIAPIFSMRCNACHGDGGFASSKHNYSTYEGIYRVRESVLTQFYHCDMPPPDATAP